MLGGINIAEQLQGGAAAESLHSINTLIVT